MNKDEMRKMWEEAANRNKYSEPENKQNNAHPPRGTAEAARRQARIKTQSDLFAIRKSSRSAAPKPKTLDPGLYGGAVNKFIPKTEETP